MVVRDNPGLWWLLALLFIGVGGGAVYVGLAKAHDAPWWQGAVATGMGFVSVTAGAWWAWRSPLSIVTVSPVRQEVRLVQVGLFGRRVQLIGFAEVDDVVVERQTDDEGGLVARPALLLRDGRTLPLSRLWRHDARGIARAVASLRSAIRSSPFAEI